MKTDIFADPVSDCCFRSIW